MNRQVFFGEAKSGPNIALSIGDLDLITLIKVSVYLFIILKITFEKYALL